MMVILIYTTLLFFIIYALFVPREISPVSIFSWTTLKKWGCTYQKTTYFKIRVLRIHFPLLPSAASPPSLSLSVSVPLLIPSMPQVDLETLVVCGADCKVACETVVEGAGAELPQHHTPPLSGVPSSPPESFQVTIGDEIDWSDLNPVYDREDSTKGSTNPKSSHPKPKSRSSSERFSGKAPIIGLPNKIQTSGYSGLNGRRPQQVCIFPKKDARSGDRGGGRKSAVPEVEPGSPKVSCFGKVLSDRELRRQPEQGQEEELERRGCWAAIFRCCGGGSAAAEADGDGTKASTPFRKIPARNAARPPLAEEPASPPEPPGLVGMKRFASSRRSASWGVEAEEKNVGQETNSGEGYQEGEGLDRRSVEDGRRRESTVGSAFV